MTVKIGENIPCFLQLFDGNVGKFVRATIRRPDNTVVGSPVTCPMLEAAFTTIKRLRCLRLIL